MDGGVRDRKDGLLLFRLNATSGKGNQPSGSDDAYWLRVGRWAITLLSKASSSCCEEWHRRSDQCVQYRNQNPQRTKKQAGPNGKRNKTVLYIMMCAREYGTSHSTVRKFLALLSGIPTQARAKIFDLI